MSIIGNLNRPNFRATKSDKLLIRYILENLDNIPYMQISQMAKEVGTGEATITRCVKKLGCRGFQEFKVGLAKEITVKKQNNIINSSIMQDEPALDTATKLAASYSRVIDESLKIIRSEDIEKAAKKILTAKKVYFIGVGFSGIIAIDSNYKFMRIGINSSSLDSTHIMMMMASIMQKGDLIVAISNSGETNDIINAVKIARDNGVETVSITSNENSTLSSISDLNLLYYSNESELETGSMNSKLAQYFMMDLIYTEVVKESIIESTNYKLKTTDAIRLLNIK